MVQHTEAFYTVTFVLFMAILVGLGIAFLTFILLWIHSKCSYKKRMKPLNEAAARQMKEAREKRKRMFSS
jgi:heme exporter protein D